MMLKLISKNPSELLNTNSLVYFTIFIGTLLRVLAATLHIDLIHADEHFQVLEPANLIVNGVGWKSWEWYHGTRSWAIPALYMPILYFLKSFGMTAGYVPIAVCRAITALLSGAMLFQFDQFLRLTKIDVFPRILTLIFISFLPAMVVWSGSTFSDQWAQLILWLVLPKVCSTLTDSLKKDEWLWAGVLIGLTFVARLQMALWPLGIALCLILFGGKERRAYLPYFFIGYGMVVIAQGFLDILTWGKFLQSVVENFKKNIFEGVADMNGISPWYFYFTEWVKNFGIVPSLILGPGIAVVWISVKRTAIKTKVDLQRLLIFIPTLVFLVGHLLIGHKELRFLLPIFPAIFFCFAHVLDATLKKYSLSISLAPNWIFLAALLLIPISWSNVYTKEHYSDADSSTLAAVIYEQEREFGLFARNQPGCLLLVDQFWHLTRGEMMLGLPVKVENVSGPAIDKKLLETCAYAMVSPWENAVFRKQADLNWALLAQDKWGHCLYKNQALHSK